MRTHHLKEHSGCDGHPMQLDLEGGVEGEVAMVVAAAPLGAVAAVVDIHVQRDRLLLRHRGSCREKFENKTKEKKKKVGVEKKEVQKKKQRDEGMTGTKMKELVLLASLKLSGLVLSNMKYIISVSKFGFQ